MSYATQWKAAESKRADIAVAVKAEFKTRAACRTALIEQFAAAYGCDTVQNEEGESTGFPKKGKAAAAAKKSLQRLLALAFVTKKVTSESTSSYEKAVAYIAKAGLTKAQALRAVEAAFKQ
jgi:hypothetical protein